MRSGIDLGLGDTALARYADAGEVDAVDSPRPHLDPVRTLGGVVTTAARTADHHHHYGMSLAVPDVDGISFWGGSTYVRGVGSTLLDNHGNQRSIALEAHGGGVRERLEWLDPGGVRRLSETRTLDLAPDVDGWTLTWRSTLEATDGDVTIGSPATNGRPGAFYGGLFWRTPFGTAIAHVDEGTGTDLAHGSHSPWLAVTTPTCTLVARRPDTRPWFIRTEDYVGFGPALAVDARLAIPAGTTFDLALTVLVTDRGALDHAAAAELAARLDGTSP